MEGSLVLCTDFHTTVFHSLINLPWYRAACEDGFLDFCECPAETCSNANRGLKMLFSGRQSWVEKDFIFLRKPDHWSKICVGPCSCDRKLCLWLLSRSTEELSILLAYTLWSFTLVDLVYRSKGGALYEIGLVEIAGDGERVGGQKRSRDPITTSALRPVSSNREDPLRDQLLDEMIAIPIGYSSPDSGELQRFPDAMGAVLTVPVATTNLLTVDAFPCSALNHLKNVRQALNLSQRGRWMMIVGGCFYGSVVCIFRFDKYWI